MHALATSAAPAKPESTSEYPNRPIRVIVAFGPASITDILTRTVMPKLSESLGQPIIVDNRPGAGGNIGTDITVKSTPDGYSLTLGSASVLALNGFL